MALAAKKKLLACALAPMLVVGYAGAAVGQQATNPGVPSAPPSGAPADQSGYFAQHFSADALSAAVKNAVLGANLSPVPFNRIIVRSSFRMTPAGQGQQGPSSYTSQITLENAGLGLVRRMELMQAGQGETATRFDLTYRGYFPFLTQTVSSDAGKLPPVIEARKVLRFDTNTDGHMNFTYLYGATGKETSTDPGQVVCDAGNRYSASQINAAIGGEALELNCQMIDENGGVTAKVTLAYLEQYRVALLLHIKNPNSALDGTVEAFNAE